MCPKVSWDRVEVKAGVEETRVPDWNIMLTSNIMLLYVQAADSPALLGLLCILAAPTLSQ